MALVICAITDERDRETTQGKSSVAKIKQRIAVCGAASAVLQKHSR
jgi:hypothetical protein